METPTSIMLAILDYTNVAQDEFNAWYDTEHIPERLQCPGFIQAQRWLSDTSPNVSLVLYDLADIGALSSDEYLDISGVNYSPWSKRIIDKCSMVRYTANQICPPYLTSPADAQALVFMALDVDDCVDVNHIGRVLLKSSSRISKVPGVICARHYLVREGPHKLIALYHLESWEALESSSWIEALRANLSGWHEEHVDPQFELTCRPLL